MEKDSPDLQYFRGIADAMLRHLVQCPTLIGE